PEQTGFRSVGASNIYLHLILFIVLVATGFFQEFGSVLKNRGENLSKSHQVQGQERISQDSVPYPLCQQLQNVPERSSWI
ncbi:MAG: hypothetical protein O7C56_01905, partial [Rickettsia endosymbiont of Ixodes persulcatus]|nr:hypothetical protein [Rickettsia endosymbiont of Ixodes persulcatus]